MRIFLCLFVIMIMMNSVLVEGCRKKTNNSKTPQDVNTKAPQDATDNSLHGSETSHKNETIVPDTKTSLQNKLSQIGIVATYMDNDVILITEGFPYRKDLMLDYKIDIVKVEKGLFTPSKDSIVPIAMMGMLYGVEGAFFTAQCTTEEKTQTYADAVGNTWTFTEPGISFDIYWQGVERPVYAMKSKNTGATISFTKEGVLIKGFDFNIYPIVLEHGDTNDLTKSNTN